MHTWRICSELLTATRCRTVGVKLKRAVGFLLRTDVPSLWYVVCFKIAENKHCQHNRVVPLISVWFLVSDVSRV